MKMKNYWSHLSLSLAVLFILFYGSSCKKDTQTIEEQSQNHVVVDDTSTTPEDTIITPVPHALVIVVDGMKNENGLVQIALYNSKDDFEDQSNAYKTASVSFLGNSATWEIEVLPAGEYGIAVYHDENNNSKLDQNILGIPKEGFAFSNNAMGSFGPPSWSDISFNIAPVIVKSEAQNLNLVFF